MHVVDSVEIRVHPLNLMRVLRDAREAGRQGDPARRRLDY